MATILAATVSLIIAPAYAFSNHDEVYLPNTGIRLQANAYSQSTVSNGHFNWSTSAKATKGGKPFAIQSIKNTATLKATGIGVTVSTGGVSGSTGTASTRTLSWTNKNRWISDLSGRGGYTGLLWRVTVNSSAFGVHKGVKKYVDVWSW